MNLLGEWLDERAYQYFKYGQRNEYLMSYEEYARLIDCAERLQ
jgi:hypothetical protein